MDDGTADARGYPPKRTDRKSTRRFGIFFEGARQFMFSLENDGT
jgi:hypothetical protein